jgi:hypothetical protein
MAVKEARSASISAVISKSDSDGLKQLLARAKVLLFQDGWVLTALS